MTTNDDVLIREVNEELAQDRQVAMLRRYGPFIAGAVALLLVLVAVLQLREARRDAARAEAAAAYEVALGDGAGPDALLSFAGTVPADGYRTLALMRAAAAEARGADRASAIRTYARVYDDEAVPRALADLARVRAGYLALADGGTAADGVVAPVATPAFEPFVLEVRALSALGRGEPEAAVSVLEAASELPGPVAQRAGSLLALARAARAGVPLEAEKGEDDFLGEFGRALRDGTLDLPAAEAEADAEPGPEPSE